MALCGSVTLRPPACHLPRGLAQGAVLAAPHLLRDRQLLVERQQVSDVRSRAGPQKQLTADCGPAESRPPMRPAASSPSTSAPRFVTGGRVCAAVFWRLLRKFQILPGAAPDGWFRVPSLLSLRWAGGGTTGRGDPSLGVPRPRGGASGRSKTGICVPRLGEAQPPRLPRGRLTQ